MVRKAIIVERDGCNINATRSAGRPSHRPYPVHRFNSSSGCPRAAASLCRVAPIGLLYMYTGNMNVAVKNTAELTFACSLFSGVILSNNTNAKESFSSLSNCVVTRGNMTKNLSGLKSYWGRYWLHEWHQFRTGNLCWFSVNIFRIESRSHLVPLPPTTPRSVTQSSRHLCTFCVPPTS